MTAPTLTEFLTARIAEDEAVARREAGVDRSGRWHPARVLAECESKRRIVALHSAEPGQHPDFCGHDRRKLPCPTLRLLALPDVEHPDFDPVWRV